MEGAVDLAEEIFHMPVRLAIPQGVSGLSDVVSNPIHATGVGLLLYGQKQQGRVKGVGNEQTVKRITSRVIAWLKSNF